MRALKTVMRLFNKPTVVAPKINTLTLYMRDGSQIKWRAGNWDAAKAVEPWKHFYKWFFGRTREFYVMRLTEGRQTMGRRSEIKAFTLGPEKRNET